MSLVVDDNWVDSLLVPIHLIGQCCSGPPSRFWLRGQLLVPKYNRTLCCLNVKYMRVTVVLICCHSI